MKYGMFTFGKIYGSIQANSTIFFLKKIPVFGNLIPQKVYRYKTLKYFFGILGTVADIIKKAIAGNLSIFLLISFIPAMLNKMTTIQNWPDKSTMIFLYIILSCFAPAIRKSNIFVSKSEDYTFLNHFMINPSRYYNYKIVKDFIIEGLLIIPILIYLFRDTMIVFSLTLSKMFFIEAGNVLFLTIYKKKSKILSSGKRILLGFLLLISIYGISLTNIFCGIIVPLGLLIAISACEIFGIIICFLYLFRFKEYKQIAVQYANNDAVTFQVSSSSALNIEGLTAFNIADWQVNKSFFDDWGYLDSWNYIHKAFQTRLKKSMHNFYKSQIYTNLFLCAGVGILIRFGILTIDSPNILKYSPMLIPLILNISFGRSYTQMCFRYMDMPMLYQHMYDTQKIASSMTSRYFLLLKNGMISLIFLILGMESLLLIAGIQIPINDFIKLCFAYIIIFVIYETYELVIYYLLQPYSVDLNVKTPFFKILSFIEGIFYASVLLARNNITEIIPALLISLSVILAIFICTRKLAYKTFKLRY